MCPLTGKIALYSACSLYCVFGFKSNKRGTVRNIYDQSFGVRSNNNVGMSLINCYLNYIHYNVYGWIDPFNRHLNSLANR